MTQIYNTSIQQPIYCFAFLLAIALGVMTSTVAQAATIKTSTFRDVSHTASSSERMLMREPIIRVGLYKTNQPVEFVSDFPYEVYSGSESQGFLLPTQTAILSYYNGQYAFSSANLSFTTTTYVRLASIDSAGYFILPSYQRPVKGRKKNFNVYRGSLEYRYSPRSNLPYIINELWLDSYVAGIAESSNDVPAEYLKALLIAARSYANASISSAPPSTNHLFDVYATTADQLYLGYNSELLMPRVAQLARDTAGQMVTYQGTPVVTPYFGHSDGQTRDFTSPSGATRPWLKSVAAPYDKGMKLWGHGIGMSCRDAELHAQKKGWSARQILQYYYTAVEVEKIF